jgi:hypothetical protein
MKASLEAGKTIVLTFGLVRALEGKGIEDLIELRTPGMQEPVTSFIGAFGPGAGTGLGTATTPIVFPQVRFLTNDAWPVVRGIADNNAFPILLMDQYSKGKLFVLTIPDNFADLYGIPELALNARSYILEDFPIRTKAPRKSKLVCPQQWHLHRRFLPRPTRGCHGFSFRGFNPDQSRDRRTSC